MLGANHCASELYTTQMLITPATPVARDDGDRRGKREGMFYCQRLCCTCADREILKTERQKERKKLRKKEKLTERQKDEKNTKKEGQNYKEKKLKLKQWIENA